MNFESSTEAPLTVSVVIPSYRRIERLPHLIERYSLLGADQIVVVLDGPHPGAAHFSDKFSSPNVHIHELPENVGLALARIEGLRLCTGDIILIVDDDVVPVTNTVDQHRERHSQSPLNLVVIGYMPIELTGPRGRDESPTYLYAREYEAATQLWTERPEVLSSGLWNGNVSVRRSTYLAAEKDMPSIPLTYNEDLDLGLRLARLAATFVFDRSIEARHHHQRDFAGFVREAWARGESTAIIQRRWEMLPHQLEDLVSPPPGIKSVISSMMSHLPISLTTSLASGLYRLAGASKFWSFQDLVSRLARRSIAQRAYREAIRSE